MLNCNYISQVFTVFLVNKCSLGETSCKTKKQKQACQPQSFERAVQMLIMIIKIV